MRILLIFRQGMRELRQLLHPNAVIPLKLDARRVQTEVISAVWSFFAVYMFCFVMIWLALLATDLDFISAFSAVVATMNNLFHVVRVQNISLAPKIAGARPAEIVPVH